MGTINRLKLLAEPPRPCSYRDLKERKSEASLTKTIITNYDETVEDNCYKALVDMNKQKEQYANVQD